MVASAATLDRTFRALADPTRRAVIARLTQSPASVSELAAAFDMALPSFMQHLQVLETSSVVRSKKLGRIRTYQLVPKRLQVAEDWLSGQRDIWERRLDQFDAYTRTMADEQ
jgi:DNA-binding transcriptional ArsR family regulator